MRQHTAVADDGYILDRSNSEYERLRAQSRMWEPMTARMLAEAGLAPGMRCLDVGCGPGEVMRLMGGIVGPDGEVTGVDLDERLGGHAVDALNAAGGARFGFARRDITADDPIPGAPFDFVFARFLLIHMTDPVAVTRRLARLARPGGRLMLMDYDTSRLAIRPSDPIIERGFAILNDCFARGGKQCDAGVRLTEYMLAAGLPFPNGFSAQPVVGPFAVVGGMLRDVLGSLEATADTLGTARPGEVAAIRQHCLDLAPQRRHFGLGPTLHCAWTTIAA